MSRSNLLENLKIQEIGVFIISAENYTKGHNFFQDKHSSFIGTSDIVNHEKRVPGVAHSKF